MGGPSPARRCAPRSLALPHLLLFRALCAVLQAREAVECGSEIVRGAMHQMRGEGQRRSRRAAGERIPGCQMGEG